MAYREKAVMSYEVRPVDITCLFLRRKVTQENRTLFARVEEQGRGRHRGRGISDGVKESWRKLEKRRKEDKKHDSSHPHC